MLLSRISRPFSALDSLIFFSDIRWSIKELDVTGTLVKSSVKSEPLPSLTVLGTAYLI